MNKDLYCLERTVAVDVSDPYDDIIYPILFFKKIVLPIFLMSLRRIHDE